MTEVGTNLQPHLGGGFKTNNKPYNNVGGYLAIAKVTKVHHKQGTVDLEIVRDHSGHTSSPTMDTQGKFGARVSTVSAHWNEKLMSSSGVVEPIQEDQLVILAFLDSYKSQPIVLGSFHQTWKTFQNVMTKDYPLLTNKFLDDYREALKYLRVAPSQMYHKIDGIGAIEYSLPSKTFMKIDPDFEEVMDDSHGGFDHKDLSEKDPVTHETRHGKTEETLHPVKILFDHRSLYQDEDSRHTKFYINKDGGFRVTRDCNNGTLTYSEFNEEGYYKLRRQLGSSDHDADKNFVEINITEEGTIQIQKNVEGEVSSIELDSNNDISVTHYKGSRIKMDSTDISVKHQKGNEIKMDSFNIELEHRSSSYIRMDSNGDIIIDAKRYLITTQRNEEVHLT